MEKPKAEVKPQKDTRPKPTRKMKAYWSELQSQGAERNLEVNQSNELKREKNLLIKKISEATIGYGMALKILAEQKNKIEEEINELKPVSSLNTSLEFERKFGISYYNLNNNESLTEKEVEEADKTPLIEEDEEEDEY